MVAVINQPKASTAQRELRQSPYARTPSVWQIAHGLRIHLLFAATVAAAIAVSSARAADAKTETAAASDDAHAWLQRMSQAMAARNYDARFLHLAGGQAENMRIIHRVVNGAVTERLVS